MELTTGSKVIIYGKPITREDPEGPATLINEYLPDEGDGLVIWLVEFDDEPGCHFLRTIYTQE